MTISRRLLHLLPRVGATLLLLAAFALTALAQTNKASIVGTVTDTSGGVVQGATVTITQTETNSTRTVPTGDDGNYEAPLLDIGTYKVSVTKEGYNTSTQENVILQTADRQRVDLQLTAGNVTADVVITAGAPLVETETSDRGSVVTGREVTELPLSGRNFTQLATLTPGVSRVTIGTLSDARANNNGDPNAGGQGPGGGDSRGSTESARFARSGGAVLSANGQRPTNNNFSVDGVDNNEPQFGTIGVFVNPDAIAEFRVTTSVPPAEVGRAAGAVVNTSFRSGTNEFHGSAYYYGQNSALNAYHPILLRNRNDAINRGDANIPRKSVLQINEFGGTIGGPIIKDRTFFFFDYLGGRNNFPTNLSSVVPPTGAASGNFSAYTNANTACNPYNFATNPDTAPKSVLCNPYTGQPFAGQQINIPLSTVAQKYFGLFPAPTANILNPNNGRQNFFSQRPVNEKIDDFDIKIDHRFSGNNQLSGRYSRQNNGTTRGSFFQNLPAGFGAGTEDGNTRQIVVTDTHTFSPTLLNEARFGYTKINIGILNCGVGGACGFSPSISADIGIPNVNDGSFEQSGITLIGASGGNGFLEFAGDGGPFIVNSKNPYFADTLTVIKGNHALKFGAETRLRYLTTVDGGRAGNLKGNFAYDDRGPIARPIVSGQTCPAASQTTIRNSDGSNARAGCFVDVNGVPYGGTGLGIADILLGLPPGFVGRGRVPGGAFHLRSQEYGLFVQDDFKASDRLTLNLGLRYDLFPSASEADARLGNFDITQRRVIIATGSNDRLVETDKNNFGPRFGFAYAIGADKHQVIRGGYGLLYTLDATDRPPGVQNPPFTGSIGLSNSNDKFNFGDTGARNNFSLQNGPPTVPPSAFASPDVVPAGVRVYFIQPQQKTAYVHQFNITYQIQFWKDYSFDIGYVGSRSRNLLATRDIGTDGTAEARNVLGQFLPATAYENRARANYNALQMQLQKRLSRNIQGQISYTFSKNKDDSTGVFQGIGEGRGAAGGPQNPFDLEAEYGTSSLDVRHLLSANAIIDLPFGKGQRYLNEGGALNKLVGGFQLNFIVNGRSGFPFTVVDCDNGCRRATQTGDPFANVPAGRFLNSAAFTGGNLSVTNANGTTIKFGSLPRNSFTGPGFVRTDMSVFKNTRLFENLTFQLGLEFFNLFNQATFTVPNNNFRDSGAFGRFDAALPGRTVQYRAKFIF